MSEFLRVFKNSFKDKDIRKKILITFYRYCIGNTILKRHLIIKSNFYMLIIFIKRIKSFVATYNTKSNKYLRNIIKNDKKLHKKM